MTDSERRKLINALYHKIKLRETKPTRRKLSAIYARVQLPAQPPPVLGETAPYVLEAKCK